MVRTSHEPEGLSNIFKGKGLDGRDRLDVALLDQSHKLSQESIHSVSRHGQRWRPLDQLTWLLRHQKRAYETCQSSRKKHYIQRAP